MDRCESCTFFGHRDFGRLEYNAYIEEILEYLILKKKVCIFLSGGMGNFDRICEGIVRKLKGKYPHIYLKLILSYPESPAFNIAKRDINLYDEIVIPNLGAKSFREAIPKRNIFMIDNCGFVISGVYKTEGGAATAVNYARSRDFVRVIDIFKKKL